jgi:hypothetical protein
VSDCGCTSSPGASGLIVPAGGRTAVPVTLDTGVADFHLAGSVNVWGRRAGRKGPPLALGRLMVTGVVRPDYVVGPNVLDFGVLASDDAERQMTVRFTPAAQPDVRVTGVTAGHPQFAATVAPPDAHGAVAVTITCRPAGPEQSGPVEAEVSLQTSSQRRPTATLLARVNRRPAVEVTPAAVVIGSDVRGAVERAIDVRGAVERAIDVRGPAGFRVLNPRCAPELGASPPVVQPQQPGHVRLVILLPDGSAGTSGTNRFTAVVGDRCHEVSIPVCRFPAPHEGER